MGEKKGKIDFHVSSPQLFFVAIESVNMEKSNFVKPRSLYFNQEGVRRRWDCVQGHDAVVCLCFHKETQSFIFVRQFRPAVYYAELKRKFSFL